MSEQLQKELEAVRAENEVLREQNFAMNKTTVEQQKEIERLTQALEERDQQLVLVTKIIQAR